jgi:hypothetical protein
MDGQKRTTTILLIGTTPAGLARISGKVSETLHQFDHDWDAGYQYAGNFPRAVELLRIGLRPTVISIMNEHGASDDDMRLGCAQLAAALDTRCLKPWVAIEDEKLAPLVGIFTHHGIIAHHATLVGVISDEEEARSSIIELN